MSNVKVEMLEKMVLEMAEKIIKLEYKVKENESKDVSKVMEASRKIPHTGDKASLDQCG